MVRCLSTFRGFTRIRISCSPHQNQKNSERKTSLAVPLTAGRDEMEQVLLSFLCNRTWSGGEPLPGSDDGKVAVLLPGRLETGEGALLSVPQVEAPLLHTRPVLLSTLNP